MKIPNFSDLVKKSNFDAKISEMEKKYFITSDDHNKFISDILDAKVTQKKLINVSDLDKNIKQDIKTLATKA